MTLGRTLAPRDAFAFDVVTVGEAGLDTICLVPQIPEADSKVRAHRVEAIPGGQAATSAVALTRLGFRCRYVGAIGADETGTALRRYLLGVGVDLGVEARVGASTRTAIVLVEDNTGRRSVIEQRDPNLSVPLEAVADDELACARIMIVDGSDLPLSLRAATLAKSRGIRTIVDLDSAVPGAMELLSLIDVVVLPATLVTQLASVSDLGRALTHLEKALPSAALVVATLGADGALARCRGHEIKVPARVVKVVDTTGAGDAFRAGLAASWLAAGENDPDVPELLDTAAIVGALNCRGMGAQASLPSWEEVEMARRGRV